MAKGPDIEEVKSPQLKRPAIIAIIAAGAGKNRLTNPLSIESEPLPFVTSPSGT
jgi:hypothetical protein